VRCVNEGARITEQSGETEVDEMDKANGGAPPNENILGFDIAVNDVSRVDKFQMEKLVLELRK
jgi:hypothetical protein